MTGADGFFDTVGESNWADHDVNQRPSSIIAFLDSDARSIPCSIFPAAEKTRMNAFLSSPKAGNRICTTLLKDSKNRACQPLNPCLGSALFLKERPERRWSRSVVWLFDSEILFMAVRIRMKRIGAKNSPVFRIVVADSRSPRDGKFIEELGTYQPLKKGDNFVLDFERAKYWISKGAQPSDTVASFIRKARKAAPAATA
jgi:small subunit ribosomal protein S16